MEPKYVEAIKAGVIGGVILAALQLVQTLLSLLNVIDVNDISTDAGAAISGMAMGAALVSCCICLLFIIVLAGTGAIAVRMTRGLLRDLNDAIVCSAVAGAVAGLVWGAFSVVLSMLSTIIKPEFEDISSRMGLSILSGVCGLLCCLPAGMVLGIVLAIVGGAIYYSLAPKDVAPAPVA